MVKKHNNPLVDALFFSVLKLLLIKVISAGAIYMDN